METEQLEADISYGGIHKCYFEKLVIAKNHNRALGVENGMLMSDVDELKDENSALQEEVKRLMSIIEDSEDIKKILNVEEGVSPKTTNRLKIAKEKNKSLSENNKRLTLSNSNLICDLVQLRKQLIEK